MTELRFFVPGLPKPAGSKRAFIIRGKGKPDRVAVTDASGKAGKDWRGDVRHVARAVTLDESEVSLETLRELQSAPLHVEMDFWLPRPKSHHGKHGVKLSAAYKHPTTRPDVLKLARGVEDSLTGIVWGDDAQIVDEHLTKQYANSAQEIGVAVRVCAA